MRTPVVVIAALLVASACHPEPAPAPENHPERSGPGSRAERAEGPAPAGRDEASGDEDSADARSSQPGQAVRLSDPPAPDRRVPGRAALVAEHLRITHLRLMRAIDDWVDPGPRVGTPLARDISRWALYQQRIYRHLSGRQRQAQRVGELIPTWLRPEQRLNVRSIAKLGTIVEPVKPPITLETTPPTPPARLRRIYDDASRVFDIRWQILAALNFVESRFGRLLGPSTAGARGPMQFLPSTWSVYGRGGNIMDPRDAVMGAARYLRASGAPANLRAALYAYNRSFNYVDAIQNYAKQMIRDPRYFYIYYYWQVFVKTTRGDVQMTGPGADVRNPRR